MVLELNDGREFHIDKFKDSSISFDVPTVFVHCSYFSDLSRNTLRAYTYALGMRYLHAIAIEGYVDGVCYVMNEFHPDFESAKKRIDELYELYSTRN